ncbi:MAG: efflux RND transporter periplasmic adaptor subunit [Candidatus Zixiibacteriota bacterium]|jgi:HlyD family secretion protein
MRNRTYILAAILMLAVAGCGGGEGTIGGSGFVETDESIVSAQTSGRAMTLHFDDGTILSTGDTIMVIDTTMVKLELSAAQAGRSVIKEKIQAAQVQVGQAQSRESYAKTEFDRVSRLLNSGTATQKQYDAAKFEYDQGVLGLKSAKANVSALQAQLKKADADIDRLRQQLDYSYPTAPINGVVTEKYIEVGELMAPGKPILKVSRIDTVWVKVYLPAGDLSKIKLGDSASVSTESGGKTLTGTVIWTASEAEFTPKNVQTKESRADLVYAVKVNIPNPDGILKIGMPVYVTLEK